MPTADELVRVVALDGPAGSGKSTVARRLAISLGWRFVDTGATYRAATLAVLRTGVPLADKDAVTHAALQAVIELSSSGGASTVLLNGEDVSSEIRGPEVTAAVSAVSAIPEVREALIVLQRQAMGVDGAVVEGRDIATVVAPRAAVKVYLDASAEVRARRRAGDTHAGVHDAGPADQEHSAGVAEGLHHRVQQDLSRRDALDSQTNPLSAARDAVHLDTSELTLEQVVDRLVELVAEAGFAADPT